MLPDDKWTKLVGRTPRAYTPHTITDLDKLKREIDEYRRTQIAHDREEHTEGITAVGTAFLDPLGRPLALSIPVPTTRFARMENRLVAELKRTRREIEGLLSAT
jgi:DNA-binding IclR family transcriptional regulator